MIARSWIFRSVHVAQVAAVIHQPTHVVARFFTAPAAMLRDDVDECRIHAGRHLLGVAADVEVRAVLEPRIQVLADAAQAVLDVLAGNAAVARERQVEAAQDAALDRVLPLGLVQELAVEVPRAEEQPVAPLGSKPLSVSRLRTAPRWPRYRCSRLCHRLRLLHRLPVSGWGGALLSGVARSQLPGLRCRPGE